MHFAGEPKTVLKSEIETVHICYLCSEYPPAPHGGIGSFVQTLARELVKKGHRVTVLGMYSQLGGVEDDAGVHVTRVTSVGPPILRIIPNRLQFLRTLEDIHRETPIDIVEGGELAFAPLRPSSPGCKVLRMHGGPTFFRLPGFRAAIAERRSFRIADKLCAVSHCVATGTREMLKLSNRPIEVIPNPVDVSLFTPKREVEEPGLIVFTGTVIERKGIRQLIQAMPSIVAQAPEAHLEVYGGEAIDSTATVPLAKILNDSLPPEIATKVAWKGRVSRASLVDILRRASVCVYPSHIEAMPLAWLEGMATGKAIVASRTGPGPEIVADGVTGLLCDPYDPESIASKVVLALKNPDLRDSLGAAARRIAVERYSLPPLVERNIDYYQRCCHSPSDDK